jgi:hypothetical protein
VGRVAGPPLMPRHGRETWRGSSYEAELRHGMRQSYVMELQRAHARVAMRNSYQALLSAALGKAGPGARARSRTARRTALSIDPTASSDSNEPGGNPTVPADIAYKPGARAHHSSSNKDNVDSDTSDSKGTDKGKSKSVDGPGPTPPLCLEAGQLGCTLDHKSKFTTNLHCNLAIKFTRDCSSQLAC